MKAGDELSAGNSENTTGRLLVVVQLDGKTTLKVEPEKKNEA